MKLTVKHICGVIVFATLSLLASKALAYRDEETGVFLTKDPAGFIDGPNQYAYVKQNPWTSFDPEGLHVWVEKGNKNEPAGHISISVGDPVTGKYNSYSFGVTVGDKSFSLKNGLQGTVYIDNQHGGAIDTKRFYFTSPESDKYVQQQMDKLVRENQDKRYPYRLGNESCRDWTNKQWDSLSKSLDETGTGKKGSPPVRTAKDINDGQEGGSSNPMAKMKPSTKSSSEPSTESSQPTTAEHPSSAGSSASSSTTTSAPTAATSAADGPATAGVGGASSTSNSAVPSTSTQSNSSSSQHKAETKKDE